MKPAVRQVAWRAWQRLQAPQLQNSLHTNFGPAKRDRHVHNRKRTNLHDCNGSDPDHPLSAACIASPLRPPKASVEGWPKVASGSRKEGSAIPGRAARPVNIAFCQFIGRSIVRVALFAPRIAVVVVAAQLPEAQFVPLGELQPVDRLGRLPEWRCGTGAASARHIPEESARSRISAPPWPRRDWRSGGLSFSRNRNGQA